MGILSSIKKKATSNAAKADTSTSAKKEKQAVTTEASKLTPTTLSTLASAVLIRPLVSEKSIDLEARGTYVFVVKKDASKLEVKKAVKERYRVNPTRVRMISMEGKQVRFGQGFGCRSDWKKALVTLPKGEKISIHEGV